MSIFPSTTVEAESKKLEIEKFGFFLYLLTDCILFAGLFATFAVLRGNTFGGLPGKEIFSLPFVLAETIILLTSSLTCGLSIVALKAAKKNAVVSWLIATFILGIAFLAMELTEFSSLIHDGNTPQRSGFLSSYFTLVGTHGLHIAFGLLWLAILLLYLVKKGLTPSISRKLTLFSLFWHFLDLVWIFIFTIVYLYGHL